MARSSMTMRAYVQRSTVAKDAYRNPLPPSWSALSTTSGFFWSEASDEVINNKTVIVERLKGFLPVGTDITAADRLEKVTDRNGTTIFAGDLEVLSVQRIKTHLEVVVRKAE